MKRLIPILFILTALVTLPLSAQAADNGAIITQNGEITVLGSNNRNQWLVKISKPYQTISLMDMNTHRMYSIPVDENGIISAQFQYIPYIRDSVIEVITCADNGIGYLYLFTTDFKVLLKARYFDSNQEKVPFDVFHAIKPFSERDNKDETISRVYRDYHLAVDYKNVKDRVVKITGYCDYISTMPDKTETILSEEIERAYKYSDSTKTFELNKTLSTLENPLWPE